MICQRCGTYMSDDSLTCEHCGTLLEGTGSRPRETGVRAIRQGRLGAMPPMLPDEERSDVPVYGDYDLSPLPLQQEHSPRRKVAPPGLASFASRPSTRRGLPVNPRGRSKSLSSRHVKTHNVKKHPINWMLLGIIGVLVVVLLFVGYTVYMRGTDEGQRITARQKVAETNDLILELAQSKDELRKLEREEVLNKLNEAPPHSYWLVGQEYLDMGDLETAIVSFQIANLLDPENYDGLLLFANTYELDADDETAETIYVHLMDVVAPSRSEAYTALIRMYLDQQRNPEAADLMLKAYENTDRETFRLQRKDFIPNTPLVDLPAGRYMLAQDVQLTSPQGYDIYYTLDNKLELPVLGVFSEDWSYAEDGKLTIPEGILVLRAFCVSENLISDPLTVTYTVYYPTPSAPSTNLAPDTYSKPRTVGLRPGSKEDEKEKDTLKFYYTIDGSTPTEESPVFDGTPIQLPSGRVTLRAICVNKYGKASSTKEVEYKFEFKPSLMKMYSEANTFDGFTLNSTSIEEFKARFGAPKSETETNYLYMENDARHLEYDWGYAVFTLSGNAWALVRVEMNSHLTAAPHGVGFGSSETDITSVYKDMGQVESPNGNRGLYYADPDIGKVIQNEDGTKAVQYSCSTLKGNTWVLQYYLKGDKVYRICHYYQP